jgi:hypothetical protein
VLRFTLAAAGLVEPRRNISLGEWLATFLAEHGESVSDRAILNLRISSDKLLAFFGPDTPLRDIDGEAAKAWRRWLTQPQADGRRFATATIAGHVKRCKQLFSAAVERGCLADNPPCKSLQWDRRRTTSESGTFSTKTWRSCWTPPLTASGGC